MTTMISCPQCARPAEIAPGEHPFCMQCDYPLFWVAPRPQPVVPVVIEPELPTGPICLTCQTQNSASRTLCRVCGQPLAPLPMRRRRSWESMEVPEEAVSRRHQLMKRVLAAVAVVALVAVIGGVLAYFFWPRSEWQIVVLDQGESSWDVSAALQRGAPVISYVDASDFTLRVVSCGNPLCDSSRSPTIHTTIAVLGDRGQGHGTAVAVGTDGHPVIAFRDGARRSLMVAHCGDPQCSDAGAITITELDPGPAVDDPLIDVGSDPSIAIGTDGLPIIAYHDSTRGALKIAHCADRQCTTASIALLDRSAQSGVESEGIGLDTAIQIGPDGLPVIAFRDADAQALKVARCSDERCTQAVILTMVQAAGLQPGHDAAMVLAPDGSPIAAYADWSDDGVYVARCQDPNCEDVTVTRVDYADDGTSGDASIVLDREGRPVVAFRQKEPGDERASRILKVVRCEDLGCTRASSPREVDSTGRTGYTPRLLTLSDGTTAIAYGDATQGALEYAYLD